MTGQLKYVVFCGVTNDINGMFNVIETTTQQQLQKTTK